MSVLNIRPAQREGAKVLIILAAQTGDGKTRTALEIGYGLVEGDPSKLGFLDTENRRGSLKADVFQKDRENSSSVPFLIGDLFAPFSPDRYIEAIREFQAAGVKCLIIDSGSHSWEGIGGCQDIAEAGNPNLPNWNKAKAAHKRLMNMMLTSDMHIILCLRAREKAKPEKQMIEGKMKTVYVDMGLQAICEKNVMYEATVSLMLHDKGRRQEVIKMEPELIPFLGREKGYITDKDGAALAAWINGAKKLDPEVEKHRNLLINTADRGMEALGAEWAKTPVRVKKILGEAFLATCKASAAEYEKQALEGIGTDENTDSLNHELAPDQAFGTSGATESAPAVKADKPKETKPATTAKPAKEEKPKPGSNPPASEQEKPEPPANPPVKKAGITLF